MQPGRHLKNFRVLAALAACIVSGRPSIGAAQDQFAPDSAVRAILAERIAAKRGTGFVVAVLEPGKSPRMFTAGTSGVDGLPLDANTVFEIGSITKVFTSTLLSDMVERGEVRLDDPISKYLPKHVRVPASKGREITLADLATQSSGLPRLPTNLRPASIANPYASYTVENLYEFLSSYTLTRDIGSQYEYSNLGVGLLAHVLSLRAGKSYETLLKERVLLPLGMTETGIRLTPPMESRMAQGFNAEGTRMSRWDFLVIEGAGALRSTAGDMVKFLAASLDSTSMPLGSVMARTRRSWRPADRPGNSIGLGWHIVDVFGSSLTWHNGGTGGYRAFIGLDAARSRGLVILTNSTVSPDDIGFHLLEAKVPLDLPAAPPQPRTEIALTETQLEPLVGVYELAPAFRLAITREGAALFGQATGQGKVRLHAEAPLKFFLKEVNAQVTFVAGSDGKVNELILHQGGANIPGKRVQ
jgi:D-alanyl-D-alanine-carboxypeptidase/D-alanyl-D-alanine-endopeptidase